jgi:GntP family gluconate:H+ symporter
MAGQPLLQALILLASVVVLVAVTRPRGLHPFVAIAAVASIFGLLAGLSAAFVAKTFGTGFSQALYSPGLLIVAVALVSGIADGTAAAAWLAGKIDRRRWLGSTSLAALAGVVAGIAASPASAFVLIAPLVRAVAPKNRAVTLALPLAISAGHGLLLVSPVMIAATSILGAPYGRVALFGLPLAIVLALAGAVWAQWLPVTEALPREQEGHPAARKRGGWSALVLLAATTLPLLLLMVRSIGDMPSEPLGGGASRELLLGLGRPLTLSWLAIGIVLVGLWRPGAKLITDSNWTARVIGDAAGILLTVAAAGGFQRLCQETGMAELLGERLASWPGGVLVPFLIAAVIKTLQGSSLVAAITTAGIMQPLLTGLGLGGESATALAALAIGAGAMTVSHLNDEYFWLAANGAGLSPLRGLRSLSIGTLLQGVIAAAALFILSALLRGV